MIIDNVLLDKLAYLSRLEIRPHERKAMLHDLNEVLAWVEQLDELNDILHKDHNAVIAPSVLLKAADLRSDIVLNTILHEEALALAPSSDSNYFRVPAVKG